jgi:hypothetical protein
MILLETVGIIAGLCCAGFLWVGTEKTTTAAIACYGLMLCITVMVVVAILIR